MEITIAEAIIDFNAQTASLEDWNNYSTAMSALRALNNEKLCLTTTFPQKTLN